MLDTVINGTRTSRSILGNLSIPEDWALARAQLVGEGWPIDFGPLNPAGLSQKGTDLNKANLLSDETAALYGLGADATPDDALKAAAGQIRYKVLNEIVTDGVNQPVISLAGLESQTLYCIFVYVPVNNAPFFTIQGGGSGRSRSGFYAGSSFDYVSSTNDIIIGRKRLTKLELLPDVDNNGKLTNLSVRWNRENGYFSAFGGFTSPNPEDWNLVGHMFPAKTTIRICKEIFEGVQE